MTQRPIAKKYCEGKLKRTLKDELKVPEIVWREAKHGRGCGGVVYLRSRWKKEAAAEEKGWEMEVFHYIVTACPELPSLPEEKGGTMGLWGRVAAEERGQEIVRVLFAVSSVLTTQPSELLHRNPSRGFLCMFHPVLEHGPRSAQVVRGRWCRNQNPE